MAAPGGVIGMLALVMATGDRVRVLAIAEAANPEWASVPLEGWSLTRALARVCDLHLVTHVRNREAVLRAGLREGDDFTAIDNESIARPVSRFSRFLRGGTGAGWTTAMALSALPYYQFERLVWRGFGDRLRAGAFDLVHRVTPLSPTIPSLLARRCRAADVPFLLGPLNGGLAWPREFDRERRREREWLSYVRDVYRLLPAYTSTRRDAAGIVIGSSATWDQMGSEHHPRCVYVPENAVDPARLPEPTPPELPPPLRVAFLGRLVPYKGPDMLIEACVPLLRDGSLQLELIGDGPLRGALEAQVSEAEVGDAVHFAGWLEHREALERLRASHVLALPSVREFGGAVVVEAMALGVVPVVVDYGGPSELVSDASGYRVTLSDRDGLVRGFREILASLVADPSVLQARAGAGRRRVLHFFTWDAKARQLLEVYDWLLGRRDKPSFGMPIADEASP